MIVILIYAVKNCPATGLIEHWLHLEAALTSASLPGFSDTMYDSPLSNFEGEDRGSFKLSPTARQSWRHACPGTGRYPTLSRSAEWARLWRKRLGSSIVQASPSFKQIIHPTPPETRPTSRHTVRAPRHPRHQESYFSIWRIKMPNALAKTHDKRNQTTTLLGVSRATPWRKMKEIGLDD